MQTLGWGWARPGACGGRGPGSDADRGCSELPAHTSRPPSSSASQRRKCEPLRCPPVPPPPATPGADTTLKGFSKLRVSGSSSIHWLWLPPSHSKSGQSATPGGQIPKLPTTLSSSGRFPHGHPGRLAPWDPPTSPFFWLLLPHLPASVPGLLPRNHPLGPHPNLYANLWTGPLPRTPTLEAHHQQPRV